MEINLRSIQDEIFRLKGNRHLARTKKLTEAVAYLNGALEALDKVVRGEFS